MEFIKEHLGEIILALFVSFKKVFEKDTKKEDDLKELKDKLDEVHINTEIIKNKL